MGPLAEVQFKRSLQISNGDYGILIEGFLPKALYTLMFLLILLPIIYKAINKKKQKELVSKQIKAERDRQTITKAQQQIAKAAH